MTDPKGKQTLRVIDDDGGHHDLVPAGEHEAALAIVAGVRDHLNRRRGSWTGGDFHFANLLKVYDAARLQSGGGGV
jgi:hypothetical protein